MSIMRVRVLYKYIMLKFKDNVPDDFKVFVKTQNFIFSSAKVLKELYNGVATKFCHSGLTTFI